MSSSIRDRRRFYDGQDLNMFILGVMVSVETGIKKEHVQLLKK